MHRWYCFFSLFFSRIISARPLHTVAGRRRCFQFWLITCASAKCTHNAWPALYGCSIAQLFEKAAIPVARSITFYMFVLITYFSKQISDDVTALRRSFFFLRLRLATLFWCICFDNDRYVYWSVFLTAGWMDCVYESGESSVAYCGGRLTSWLFKRPSLRKWKTENGSFYQ